MEQSFDLSPHVCNNEAGANPSGGAPKHAGQNIDKLKEVRLRATILFNIRPGAGIQVN